MVSICVGSVNSVVGVVGMLVDSGGGSGSWVTNWDFEVSIFCEWNIMYCEVKCKQMANPNIQASI